MAKEHSGFSSKVRHVATFYSHYHVSPGGVLKACWDGKLLATCDVDFDGEWYSTDCYCDVDGFSGCDLDTNHYVFNVWDKSKGRSFSLDADDPVQEFGEQ